MQVIQYARELPCYLNRQFITLLSTLGVPDEAIEARYRVMVATLDKVRQKQERQAEQHERKQTCFVLLHEAPHVVTIYEYT